MRFLIIYRRYVKWQREFFKVFKKEKFTEGKENEIGWVIAFDKKTSGVKFAGPLEEAEKLFGPIHWE